MTLEAIVTSVKNTLIEEIWEYPGKKGCVIGNAIRTALGYAGFQYFDNDILQGVCITYAVIKGIQCIKDIVRYVW